MFGRDEPPGGPQCRGQALAAQRVEEHDKLQESDIVGELKVDANTVGSWSDHKAESPKW